MKLKERLLKAFAWVNAYQNVLQQDYHVFRDIYESSMKQTSLTICIILVGAALAKIIQLVFTVDQLPTGGELRRLSISLMFALFLFFFYRGDRWRTSLTLFVWRFFDLVMMLLFGYICFVCFIEREGVNYDPLSNSFFSLRCGILLMMCVNAIRHRALRVICMLAFFVFLIASAGSTWESNYSIIIDLFSYSAVSFCFFGYDKATWVKMIKFVQSQVSNEKDYRLIMDLLPAGIAIVDEDLNILHSNSSLLSRLQSAGKFSGCIFQDVKPIHSLSGAQGCASPVTEELVKGESTMDPRHESLDYYIRKIIEDYKSAPKEVEPYEMEFDWIEEKTKSVQCFDASLLVEQMLSRGSSDRRFSGDPQKREVKTPFEIRMCPAEYASKPVAVIVINDISKLRENIALKEQDRFKTLLIGSVSHEIRSPLNATISMMNCAYEDKEVAEYVKKTYLSIALVNAKLLLHIVNDILDYSQIDFGKIRIVPVEFNLQERLLEIIQLLSFQAAAKRITLNLNLEKDANLPVNIKTDPNRLSQIIINLLNNALKFTEKGSITLRVSSPSGLNSIRFEVIDTGIGIKEEDQRKLFGIFTKIDLGDKVGLNASGAGLGLTLCQNLLKLLGSPTGLRVNSEYGKGSTFHFDLSVKSKESMNGSSFRLAEYRERNKSLHLLPIQVRKASQAPEEKVAWLIDDSPFNTLALEMLLKPYKIPCLQISDPFQALNMFKDMAEPDEKILIIFTDIEMPLLNGIELMKQLHQILRGKKMAIPIVACTGNAGDDYCETLMKEGFDDYLVKPVQSPVLERILLALAKRSKA